MSQHGGHGAGGGGSSGSRNVTASRRWAVNVCSAYAQVDERAGMPAEKPRTWLPVMNVPPAVCRDMGGCVTGGRFLHTLLLPSFVILQEVIRHFGYYSAYLPPSFCHYVAHISMPACWRHRQAVAVCAFWLSGAHVCLLLLREAEMTTFSVVRTA